MSANRFGSLFQWTSFGESHGPSMGVVIEGCPSGLQWNQSLLEDFLGRRRPGQVNGEGVFVSPRNEPDQPRVLSGVFDGKTLGTPIAIIVENKDARSQDYSKIKDHARVGHADDMWQEKFGHWDHRGGGRASARETLARVAAGAVAQMIVQALKKETSVYSYIEQVGPLKVPGAEERLYDSADVESVFFGFPGSEKDLKQLLSDGKRDGESYGGSLVVCIDHPEKSLGQPVFNKLKSDLAAAFFSIGSSMSVELGHGVGVKSMKGTDLHRSRQNISYGGIRGGLSTGEKIVFRLSFKPTSSITDVAKKGRHDPCIVPRARPVVEAMAWAVLADHMLWKRLDRIK